MRSARACLHSPRPLPPPHPPQVYAELRRESSVTHGMPIAVRHLESMIRMSEVGGPGLRVPPLAVLLGLLEAPLRVLLGLLVAPLRVLLGLLMATLGVLLGLLPRGWRFTYRALPMTGMPREA